MNLEEHEETTTTPAAMLNGELDVTYPYSSIGKLNWIES